MHWKGTREPIVKYKPTKEVENLLEKSDVLNDMFIPSYLLPNGIIQTLFYEINSNRRPLPKYDREIFKFKNGGQTGLDWIGPQSEKGIITIIPGLTGDLTELYVINMANEAVKNGYQACVPITTSKIYCACASWDYQEAIEHIQNTHPGAKLFAVGFSLGANLLAKYLGEAGENSCVIAAV